jgi:hypothetical protein
MIRADHRDGDPIVPYRRKELPRSHEEALLAALDILADSFAEDLRSRSDREYLEGALIQDYLPPKHRRRYGKEFGRKFLACLRAVAWKFKAPGAYKLGSVGEEMAMNGAIEFARDLLADKGVNADFELFRALVFEDVDFEMLYLPGLDGIEDDPPLDYVNLRFEDWFEPFQPDLDEYSPRMDLENRPGGDL